MQRRLVYIYLLNVPSLSSRYFNKINRTSCLGRLLALSLEILYNYKYSLFGKKNHFEAQGVLLDRSRGENQTIN